MLRGKARRQAIIIRLLAVERGFRAILLALAVWAVLAFRHSQNSIQTTFDRDLPAFRNVGIHVDQISLVRDLQTALNEAPGRLTLIAVLLAGYAVLEVIEGAGLWLRKRWGEYFAVIATSIFLPLKCGTCSKASPSPAAQRSPSILPPCSTCCCPSACSDSAAAAEPTTLSDAENNSWKSNEARCRTPTDCCPALSPGEPHQARTDQLRHGSQGNTDRPRDRRRAYVW